MRTSHLLAVLVGVVVGQHVWVWKPDPAGLLAMYNPDVHCAWA